MSQKGLKGIQSKTIKRACQLAEALEKDGCHAVMHFYPQTEIEYERCKKTWDSFTEEGIKDSKSLVYKTVVVYFPKI